MTEIPPQKTRFCIVGSGWRADFYHRVARALPEFFEISGVYSRSEGSRARVQETWDVPTYESIPKMIGSAEPDFLVSSVSWDTTIPMIIELSALGIPVLSETTLSATDEEILQILGAIENGYKLQIAEQVWLQPWLRARLEFAQSGKLGEISTLHLSAGGHIPSLIRKFLNVSYGPAEIRAMSRIQELVEGPGRYGLPSKEKVQRIEQQHYWVEFESGQTAIVDSSSAQFFNPIRSRSLRIQGSRGEIAGDEATYLADFQTPVVCPILCSTAGIDGNLEGNYLKHIQIGDSYRYINPWQAALNDDEIAVTEALQRMKLFCDTGTEYYSFRRYAQDIYMQRCFNEAIRSKDTVKLERKPWAE